MTFLHLTITKQSVNCEPKRGVRAFFTMSTVAWLKPTHYFRNDIDQGHFLHLFSAHYNRRYAG
jgi:hypothetical protein